VREASPEELRVLGCLIEKQRTTPDAYPLSVNALRNAANQSTNRDPVLDLDERTVHSAAQELGKRGWARFTSGHGSRAAKYRQTFDEALGLGRDETAVLGVLMLRGPQTPGELKGRAGRLHAFASLEDLQSTLDRLAERELVAALERRPGQKEQRYRQLLGGDGAEEPAPPRAAHGSPPDLGSPELDNRVEEIERQVADLRQAVDALRAELGG
jgi:uncharacterized protein YceH (UPF0502 family)